MNNFFVHIHYFIAKHRVFFILTSVIIFIFSTYILFNINFKEDISSIIPKDKRINEISSFFSSSKLADKIIVNISLSDTNLTDDEKLIKAGQHFYNIIKKDTTLINKIDFKVDESSFLNVYDFVYENLPLYLDDADYTEIQSMLYDSVIKEKIFSGYKSLISPTGFATKKYFFKDPLNIVPIALKKLQNFQIDENFVVHKQCVFSKDFKHLFIFINPFYKSNNTKENIKLVKSLNEIISTINTNFNDVNIEFYGGTVVATENSIQIKKDIFLTISVSLILLSLILWFFFRKIRIIALLFLPVAIGAMLALVILSFFINEISVISIGIGGIILCISIDFSLHVITHNRETDSIAETIKNVAIPVLISGVTTAAALFCIYILKSDALEQLSLFAAIGIIITSLAAIIILPLFLKNSTNKTNIKTNHLIDKIINIEYHKNTILIIAIILISSIFLFTVKNLKFNGDISTLNYQSKKVTKAENNLRKISSEANSGVFIFTHDQSLEKALLKAENNLSYIKSLQEKGFVKSFSTATDLLLTKQAQKNKIDKWNKFWNDGKKQNLTTSIIKISTNYKIKNYAFNDFFNLINKKHSLLELKDFDVISHTFLDNYINFTNNQYYIASLLKANKNSKPALINNLIQKDNIVVYDNQLFINQILNILKEDFNRLSFISNIVVFVMLLLFFGRIEIAVITYIPIVVGWFWTLGLMSVFGIEFNVFNIIITSFIFGLGMDYSIFIISGLIENHKYGNKSLAPYKLSVLLSALTTIAGFGVLILAKHPALRSIAIVSIYGIFSVLIISFTLIPVFFHALIYYKNKRRTEPVTLSNSIVSIISFIIFLLGSLFMNLLIPVLYITPTKRKHKKYFMSLLIHLFSKLVVSINLTIKRDYIDKKKLDFSKPSVIISNHQSHLDLVLILMLNPKIIVFTNKWVWHNIFYGFIIRYADYFPAFDGISYKHEQINQKISEGYSILIFPEGTRTKDGTINRFHQGAFHVASIFNLDIQPIIIHGAYNCLPKSEFFLKSGHITIKFIDRIKPFPVETEHGITFLQQAKSIRAFYKQEYYKIKQLKETPGFYKKHLLNQYIYKGPVLEWYLKIKIKLEKNYNFFNNTIPANAKIVDIGCGYGLLSYMLKLTATERKVTGIDYDDEKINIANNLPIKDDKIEFKIVDISEQDIPKGDVYILSDVLHYLPEKIQLKILNTCIDNISNNGMLIIREADTDLKNRTKITKLTEIQSTKIFNFNKTKYSLTFVSGNFIKNLAKERNLICEVYDNTKFISNITYILKRNA